LSDKTIEETQNKYNCCGFNNDTSFNLNEPKCPVTAKISCFEIVRDSVVKALEVTGSIALVFSFINVFALIYS
jgi:hypothetical protein